MVEGRKGERMIIIMGRAGTGKTSLVNELVKRGYEKIKTCTTRPIRDGEEDGVDYFFLTDDQFHKYAQNNYFAEIKKYYTTEGEWLYGTPKVELLSSDEKSVIILTPDGVRAVKPLLDSRGIHYTVVLIGAKASVIKRRMIQRGDDMDEIIRRIRADDEDFEDCEEFVNFTLSNAGSIQDLANELERKLQELKEDNDGSCD